MSLTLGIIKPDAVQSGKAGSILAHLEASGFTVRALQMTGMSTVQAGAFYAVHKERPFFDSLVSFMTSGAITISASVKSGISARRSSTPS